MKSNPALLVMGVLGLASAVMAQSPGTFTATGSMNAPRAGHTATLLDNGKVLVAAGFSSGGYLPSRSSPRLSPEVAQGLPVQKVCHGLERTEPAHCFFEAMTKRVGD